MSKLYHISFNGGLAKEWRPQVPSGFGEMGLWDKLKNFLEGGGKITEPKTPRICLAPTIEGCFRAIYPNVSSFFEENHYPHLDMYVYEPDTKDYEIVENAEIIENRWVYDAHITKEVWITSPVKMRLSKKVRIFNTIDEGWRKSFAFKDPETEFEFGYLKVVKFEVLTTYPKIVANESYFLDWI